MAVTVCADPGFTCTQAGESADMKARPAQILLYMDGGEYLKNLAWRDWGDPTATGTGILEVNGCTPDCADGIYTAYPATVTLSRLTTYVTGHAAYAALSVSAPGTPGAMPSFSPARLIP